MIDLDYSLKTTEERIALVNSIVEKNPNISDQQKGYLADYILFTADKNQTKREHKEEKPIVTKNREITVSKRQTSYEQLVSSLEGGEDALFGLIRNDKNQLLDHKDPISDSDIRNIPGIKDQLDIIDSLKQQFDKANGYAKYSLKRQIIETWQQIYILKASFKGIPAKGRTPAQVRNMAHIPLDEIITFDRDGMPQSTGMLTLFNPAHVSFLLCYYSALKTECWDDLYSDMHFLLLDLENLAEEAIKEEFPVLWDILIWKVDGLSNEEIQDRLQRENGIVHNEQYISTLWRKRIPKLISDKAKENYLMWYYTNKAYGKWKTCNKCGQTKLAHLMFFSKNNSSQDGLYSVCKECRSAKNMK